MTRLTSLVLMLSFVSLAYAVDMQRRFGEWAVIRASDGVDLIALTLNDSGSFIGFRCFASTQMCIHALSAGTKCEDGGNYPILINSDYSSLSMDAICSINGTNHELFLTKYDVIHDILLKGNHVGFAIPMESGQFKVVRFSLDGSDAAMNFVEQQTTFLGDRDSYL